LSYLARRHSDSVFKHKSSTKIQNTLNKSSLTITAINKQDYHVSKINSQTSAV